VWVASECACLCVHVLFLCACLCVHVLCVSVCVCLCVHVLCVSVCVFMCACLVCFCVHVLCVSVCFYVWILYVLSSTYIFTYHLSIVSIFFLSFILLIGWQFSIWNCCRPFFSLLYNCQLLCFGRLGLCIIVEVFLWAFIRRVLLQGCQ